MDSNEVSHYQKQSTLDCSLYADDYAVINSFPFHFIVSQDYSLIPSSAHQDTNNRIDRITIVNQNALPVSFFCLKHLTYFGLFNTSIIPFKSNNDADFEFPREIERFAPSVESIHIIYTKITKFPEEFGKLKHLVSFDMRYSSLVSLPDSFGNLTGLEFLRLNNNNLKSLPKTMANIQSINMMILDENPQLDSLQSLNGMRNLRYLHATGCIIDRLPYYVADLKFLLMPRNKLTNLYGIETLGYNSNETKEFIFYENRINYIPPEIRKVRNLHTLVLADNQLSSLPNEIFQIDTLAVLDIRNNSFSSKELNAIVQTFRMTHPNLTLYY